MNNLFVYCEIEDRIENRETDIITKIQEYYLKAQYRKEGYHPYCDAKGEFTAKLIRVEAAFPRRRSSSSF